MDIKKIIIREYIPTDKKNLYLLAQEFINFFVSINKWGKNPIDSKAPSYFMNEMFKLAKKKNGKIFIAELEGILIGFMCIYIKGQTYPERLEMIPMRIGYINDLFVHERYRGNKLGYIFLETAYKYFKTQNCTHSILEVFGPNVRAHKFYKDHGYEDIRTEMIRSL